MDHLKRKINNNTNKMCTFILVLSNDKNTTNNIRMETVVTYLYLIVL